MKRTLFLSVAAALCGAAFALCGPAGFALAVPAVAVTLAVMGVSASNERAPAPRNGRNTPHWLTVALYRAECFAVSLRNKLGVALSGAMFRSGLALRAFPGSVAADLAFGIVGERAFDGPFRSQPARISHATAADIVIGRWFTLAADGTARPGGAGAIGGMLMAPKTQVSGGTAGNALAATMTLLTGTIGEFGYMGQFVVAAPAAVALGNAAKFNDTTGVIGVGAPGAGETAIPNSKFVRVFNAAAGLAVLELTN